MALMENVPVAVQSAPTVAPNVVQQALQAQGQLMQGAQKQIAADPLQQAIDAEMAKTAAAQAAVRPAAEESYKRSSAIYDDIGKISASPLPEQKLLDAPAPPPTELPSDPLRTIGQFLPVLAALSGNHIRTNATAALNSATAAMNAAHTDDQAALAAAHKSWLDRMEYVLKENQVASDRYNAIMNNRKISMDDRLAQLRVEAAKRDDLLGLAAINGGHPEALIAKQQTINAAADKLRVVYDATVKADQEAAALRETARGHDLDYKASSEGHAATIEAARISAGASMANAKATLAQRAAELLKQSPTDILGQAMQVLAGGGQLSVGQKQAIDLYTKVHAATDPLAAYLASQAAGKNSTLGTPGSSAANPVRPTSRTEAAALSPGTWFTDPMGVIIQKK